MISQEITLLRDKIDNIDKEICSLLIERFKVVQELKDHKHREGTELYSPDREREIMSKVNCTSSNLKERNYLSGIYERILDESRKVKPLA